MNMYLINCYCLQKNVSKSAFTFIYQWMLYHGGDSFKLLRMDNILDIYMAAKFLKIEGNLLIKRLKYYFLIKYNIYTLIKQAKNFSLQK